MRCLYYIFRDLFITSLAFLLVVLILEDLRPNFVSVWLDLRMIFYLVVFSGVVVLFTSQTRENLIKY